jgi:hypothetical protein
LEVHRSAQSAAVQEVGPAKPSTDDRIANLARAMKLGKSDPAKDINSYLEHRTRELSTRHSPARAKKKPPV